MTSFLPIRQAARELRASLGPVTAGAATGRSIINAALEFCEIDLALLPPGDLLLTGALAVFDRRFRTIFCVNDIAPELVTYYVAHEIGHAILHSEPERCGDRDMEAHGRGVGGGAVQKVEAYGAKERKEAQANVFAREFLLPRELARSLFIDRAMGSRTIAGKLGLPLDIVRQQLADSLLLPETPHGHKAKPKQGPVVDPSQDAAVTHMGTPLLLEAGPGAGKTRTLVARVLYLLERGEDPSSILVLTFSNKAAAEFRERIEEAAPDRAAQVWAGTFHAFGLDLLRKHHDALKLPPDLRLLDNSDALDLMEEELTTLPQIYLDLWEPARELKHVLKAISRAKDELVGPERYRALAQAMIDTAPSSERKEAGEKALEVAKIYDAYERALQRTGAVDFGDLVVKPVLLLRSNEQVRALVRTQYRHILVDEYQDVNRATACLIREISGEDRHPWIVGDSRQSIYRFRGASSANMARFNADYPRAERKALGVNYRSSESIVELFQAFSQTMLASEGQLPLLLEAKRGQIGTIPELRVLPDEAVEADALAGEIEALNSAGVAYGDQAVLCGNNSGLAHYAEALEARGVPVLYFGPLFERSEVRDLLCLLWAVVDKTGAPLIRVAGFPEYQVPLADMDLLLQAAHLRKERPFTLLSHANLVPGISKTGASRLMLLGRHLDGASERSMPWHLLVEYLFDRSSYLRNLMLSDALPDAMRRIAIWQLSSAVREIPVAGHGPPIRRMLDRFRRMIVLEEDRELRNLPPEAEGIDAVRLMTVHASKGLEFDAVHLPSLMNGTFPRKKQQDRCPPPVGLVEYLPGHDESVTLLEEEECLFFVALSRARGHLKLYRPEKNKGRRVSPAEFLLAERLPIEQVPAERFRSRKQTPQTESEFVSLRTPRGPFTPSEIERYKQCPRRYFYDFVLGLKPEDRDTAFLRTQRCIRDALDYAKTCGHGRSYDKAETERIINGAWATKGPSGHAFEAGYRVLLQRMVSQLHNAHEGYMVAEEKEWEIPLGDASVVVRPDQFARRSDGTNVIRKFRTGRGSQDEADKLLYTLYHLAARENLTGMSVVVEAVHLTAQGKAISELTQTDRKLRNRLDTCKQIIAGILSCHFPALADDHTCMRCPYYFICPSTAAKQAEPSS